MSAFFSDESTVKVLRRFSAVVLCLFAATAAFSIAITYKEQYYQLFHQHYQEYPEDVMENIYWLERAVAADFCNPRYALAKIEDETQWEKYRYLFMMHVNIKLAEQHLRLGKTWDKEKAYFYDAPLKDEFLRNLDTAETCYQTALFYWGEAQLWAEKANQKKFFFLYITDQQFWEDERARIYTGELDYAKTINRELKRLQNVRETLQAMDGTTY